MGRAEACANSQPPPTALLDGFFNGLGYSLLLLLVAVPRELLGMGTILGAPMPFFSGPHWDKWVIMVMPPGAFFMLAGAVWAFRTFQKDSTEGRT
jgi:Na+-transporting NADH:ubiquinone oxidoreductase subunit D